MRRRVKGTRKTLLAVVLVVYFPLRTSLAGNFIVIAELSSESKALVNGSYKYELILMFG